MPPVVRPRRQERGMALVMALLVLLVLSLLGAVLMATVGAERRLAARGVRQVEALQVAEAGVDEALTRIRNDEIEKDGSNPRMVAQIFNAPSGSVPALGADSTALATGQPAGQWMPYSTAGKGPDVLTVRYKTNNPPTVVYRYDKNLANPVQTATGYPIFVVTSTGRVGPDRARITGEYIQKPYIANAYAALTANVAIDFSGTADVCGFNHSMNTPVGTEGVNGTGGPCVAHELGTGHLPGAWSSGTIQTAGASEVGGNPPMQPSMTGFYAGPWEVLGMSQAEYWSWIGAPQSSIPGDLNGIIHLDHNSTHQDASGSFGFHGGNGEGLLYIDGDAHFNAGFNYKGLIYVEGDLDINGHAWILGGLIVRGVTEIKVANGNFELLYSRDAIEQNISKYGGQFVRLSWIQQ